MRHPLHNPKDGEKWFNTSNGLFYIYDVSLNAWVSHEVSISGDCVAIDIIPAGNVGRKWVDDYNRAMQGI